eukprot:CAMPEP_0115520414 /NCGR_PEP_ID=MMETSP0271-20121206/78969_1 /TAXON_ID=71861 /ORGANISM="Scrippsiella trochoidea, Strain CCMP3099" /LENGTH=101 /DNA_ID=CAMNT_0002951515 /DNA_START=1 /DNA_END=303 /DNA_ORIENTATION=+
MRRRSCMLIYANLIEPSAGNLAMDLAEARIAARRVAASPLLPGTARQPKEDSRTSTMIAEEQSNGNSMRWYSRGCCSAGLRTVQPNSDARGGYGHWAGRMP